MPTVDFEVATDQAPREVAGLQPDGAWGPVPTESIIFAEGNLRVVETVSVKPLDLVAYRFLV